MLAFRSFENVRPFRLPVAMFVEYSSEAFLVHFHLFNQLAEVHPFLQYFIWVAFTLALVLLAAASCYFISPQAVGKGVFSHLACV